MTIFLEYLIAHPLDKIKTRQYQGARCNCGGGCSAIILATTSNFKAAITEMCSADPFGSAEHTLGTTELLESNQMEHRCGGVKRTLSVIMGRGCEADRWIEMARTASGISIVGPPPFSARISS